MTKELLLMIVVAIIVFLILLTLLKSLFKAGIVIFIFVILFRVGWVYTSNDLKEKLHLDSLIKEEYQEGFFNKYDDYSKRRKEDEIIDTENMNNEIDNQLKNLNDKVDNFIND